MKMKILFIVVMHLASVNYSKQVPSYYLTLEALENICKQVAIDLGGYQVQANQFT